MTTQGSTQTKKQYRFWVSEKSWNGLQQLANRFNKRGRTTLIEDLHNMNIEMVDTRPELLKEYDEFTRPVWCEYGGKLPRSIVLSNKAYAFLTALSYEFNITNAYRISTYSRESVVVEAIGLEWLSIKEKHA